MAPARMKVHLMLSHYFVGCALAICLHGFLQRQARFYLHFLYCELVNLVPSKAETVDKLFSLHVKEVEDLLLVYLYE